MEKSKFQTDAETMKAKLDEVSPSFCLAKWKQVSLHLTTGMNNSCYHPPLHHINVNDIKKNPAALHNTHQKKITRMHMMRGDRPQECSYCWAMEDNGKFSDRHYRSGEPWAAKDYNAIVANPDADVTPSYVEVNFNHACNLACSYCSPQFSSTWMQHAEQFGAYPTEEPHNDPRYFTGRRRPIPNREENPYVDAFWEWWPELYKDLIHFRMTGGEPMMDKNTYRVFDYVLDHPKEDLHLNVTSNFAVDNKLWEKYISYVKRLCDGRIEHFMQYVSVDGWGQKAEYMRAGLNHGTLWQRVHAYLAGVPSYNSLTFIITMNNLSVTSLKQFLEGILSLRQSYSDTYQRVWFDTPVLRQPEWQSLQILPEEYADILEETKEWMQQHQVATNDDLHGFKDFEINRLDRDIAWMRNGTTDVERKRADFFRFFSEYDSRHAYSFTTTFPEMEEFWNICKYEASIR